MVEQLEKVNEITEKEQKLIKKVQFAIGSGYSLVQYISDQKFTSVVIFVEPKFIPLFESSFVQFGLQQSVFVRYASTEKRKLKFYSSNYMSSIVFNDIKTIKVKSNERVIAITHDKECISELKKKSKGVVSLERLANRMFYYGVQLRPLANYISTNPDVTFVFTDNPKLREVVNPSESDKMVLEKRISREQVCASLEMGGWLSASKTFSELGLTEEDVNRYAKPPKSLTTDNGREYEDFSSDGLNIVDGRRLTVDQPEEYERRVWVFGGCNQFGTYSPDCQTSSSHLQRALNKQNVKIRVENLAMYMSGRRTDAPSRLYSAPVAPNDIVIIGNAFSPYLDTAISSYKNWHTLSLSGLDGSIYGDMFVDTIHLSPNGQRAVADRWFEYLKEKDFFRGGIKESEGKGTALESMQWTPAPLFGILPQHNNLYGSKAVALQAGLHDYVQSLRQLRLDIGAIVMNCNPFTLGHRYLIEYASSRVRQLYIFVVEENKSVFEFADRLELVKKGTADLPNVTVLASGKFIISSLTFSDYFNKAQIQERKIDPSQDVETFGKHIAPALGINVRFAGEEPLDNITQQYNDAMNRILPKYGVKFEVIPRKQIGGEVVSASRVRKLLETKDFGEIEKIVPPTTLRFLLEKFGE